MTFEEALEFVKKHEILDFDDIDEEDYSQATEFKDIGNFDYSGAQRGYEGDGESGFTVVQHKPSGRYIGAAYFYESYNGAEFQEAYEVVPHVFTHNGFIAKTEAK